MKILDTHGAGCELARALGKPVVFFSTNGAWELADEAGLNPVEEIEKAIPWLRQDPNRGSGHDMALQSLADGQGFIVCEDEAEMWRVYNSIVGDDGPTELNPYAGPAHVYALTIDATGELGTENT